MAYPIPTNRATTRDSDSQRTRQSSKEINRAVMRDTVPDAIPRDAQIAFAGTLHVKLVQGRFGPFPVGTLYTAIGAFTVRDEWLKSLSEGEFEGIFNVAELSLYSYRAYGEQRTTIRAIIGGYHLCDTTVEDDFTDHDAANDGFMPHDDDCYIPEDDVPAHGDSPRDGTTTGVVADSIATTDNSDTQATAMPSSETTTDAVTADAAATADTIDIAAYEDDNVRLLRSYLVGTEREGWQYGEPYRMDTSIGRPHIAKCRAALDALGYVLDIRQQLWLLADEGGAL